MKVWLNTRFKGHYPVGTSAVVVADTAERAAELLNEELQFVGLGGATADQFDRLVTSKEVAVVLNDGNY